MALVTEKLYLRFMRIKDNQKYAITHSVIPITNKRIGHNSKFLFINGLKY